MRPTLLLTLVSVVAAASGCSRDITGATYPGNNASARGHARASDGRITLPFKAKYDAHVVSVGPGPGCDARLYLEGAGTGTRLGNFTINLGFCGRADGTLDTGTGTFVAANGDLLYIIFDGVSDGGHPILHFTSYVTFTRGTGHFYGATGTATVNGIFDATTGGGPADWEGTISFPR